MRQEEREKYEGTIAPALTPARDEAPGQSLSRKGFLFSSELDELSTPAKIRGFPVNSRVDRADLKLQNYP
jgi:hypothetical protein